MRIGIGSISGVCGSHDWCEQTWAEPSFSRPIRPAKNLFCVCSYDGSG